MEIRVTLNSGVMIHTFTCKKEWRATLLRYISDPTVRITVKL